MNILEMNDTQIISQLSNERTDAIMTLIAIKDAIGTDEFRKLAIDLEDMRFSGKDIEVAFNKYCGGMVTMFVSLVMGRSYDLVRYLHNAVNGSNVRQHGEQLRIKPLDAAIKNIIADAEQQGNLKRVDEGADFIHNFFLGMLATMQKERKFVSNLRVNLAGMADKAAWGVFAIHFVELVDADGKPLNPADQPQNEANPFPKPSEGSGWKAPAVESPEDAAVPEKRAPYVGETQMISVGLPEIDASNIAGYSGTKEIPKSDEEDGPVVDNGEPLR